MNLTIGERDELMTLQRSRTAAVARVRRARLILLRRGPVVVGDQARVEMRLAVHLDLGQAVCPGSTRWAVCAPPGNYYTFAGPGNLFRLIGASDLTAPSPAHRRAAGEHQMQGPWIARAAVEARRRRHRLALPRVPGRDLMRSQPARQLACLRAPDSLTDRPR